MADTTNKTITIGQMLEHVEYQVLSGSLNEEAEVTALVYDSRKIVPGCLFVCMKGAAFDGHRFVQEAADKGALAVVVEQEDVAQPEGLAVIHTANTRKALALLSAALGLQGQKVRRRQLI